MRFRGMDWRIINEMSGAMLIEAVLIVAAYWAGVLPSAPAGPTTSLWQWQHGSGNTMHIHQSTFDLAALSLGDEEATIGSELAVLTGSANVVMC